MGSVPGDRRQATGQPQDQAGEHQNPIASQQPAEPDGGADQWRSADGGDLDLVCSGGEPQPAVPEPSRQWVSYNLLRGQYMSALEHAVPEQFFSDPQKCNFSDASNPTAGRRNARKEYLQGKLWKSQQHKGKKSTPSHKRFMPTTKYCECGTVKAQLWNAKPGTAVASSGI